MNKERIQKVAENMRAEGLEQILVTAPTSVFYLTGKWLYSHKVSNNPD